MQFWTTAKWSASQARHGEVRDHSAVSEFFVRFPSSAGLYWWLKMTDSRRLLEEYVRTGSETAFGELAARYVGLVYSAALRLVEGDTHRAEDVAQTVFVDLARKARRLPKEVMLGGWLHRHTCFVAANAMRGERRRQSRERQAVEMNALQDNPGADFSLIAPILDEAINELGEADRTAILLRFFEQRDFGSVGEALGSNEDAARMRVNRALGKLESLLKRRGVTTSAAAVGVALSVNAVQAVPAALAAAISGAAVLAGTAVQTSTVIAATKAIAMTTLQKTLITAAIAAAVGAGIYEARQNSRLRGQVQSLQQQQAPLTEQIQQLTRERDDAIKRLAGFSAGPAPRLPAPPFQAATPPAEDLSSTNLYERFERFKEKAPKLTVEQVGPYLKANGRNAASLLAAYRTTREPSLLAEAMQSYPNDPQVAFEAIFKNDASAQERRQWLDTFKKSEPDNALANYLSAVDYFKSGQTDQAVQEFMAASGKRQFQDYTAERYQDDAEAFLAAGYSVADAKTASGMHLLLPQLAPVKELGLDMIELAKSYRQAGDDASAQAALQMAINLGQRYSKPSPGEPTVSQLVGLHLEGLALNTMDPNSPYGDTGQTVQDRLNQLAQQNGEVRESNRQVESIFPKVSDQDWISYRDRWLMFGEENAERWLINKYGQK